jgi:hypothetical protein
MESRGEIGRDQGIQGVELENFATISCLNILNFLQIHLDSALTNVVLESDILIDLFEQFYLAISDENFLRILDGSCRDKRLEKSLIEVVQLQIGTFLGSTLVSASSSLLRLRSR